MGQRLFVGIELPASVRKSLTTLQANYPTARWHPPEALHLTLVFIGQVSEQVARGMAAGLSELACPALALEVKGVGHFGAERKPTVIWAGVETSASLLRLQQCVEQRLLPLGLVADERPYRPHITLARVREGGEVLQQFLHRHREFRLSAFEVDQFCLYVSRGGPEGVRYEVIERFSLLKR